MYKKSFELLLRGTEFSKIIFEEIWDSLSSSERIYLMMNFDGLEEGIIEKALDDSNPFIRMLAVNYSSRTLEKHDDDESLLVKISLKGSEITASANALKSFSHIERLGIIALSNSLSGESFAEFICDGLKSNLFSEREASQMLMEYVSNPDLIDIDIGYSPDDDWLPIGYMQTNFDAIWNLTTCTPPDVHYLIANEYCSWQKTVPRSSGYQRVVSTATVDV